MLVQRGASDGTMAAGKPATPRRDEARARPANLAPKMSFKERHELEKILPPRIAALQAEMARCQALLADGSLYTRDAAKFEAATAGLAKAEAELVAAEERWLELEMKRAE
jgi:ATP-binding cassette subfamily F protein uup